MNSTAQSGLHRTVVPLNTGWDEQGMKGVTRLQDYQHDGIVADDPQLRTATLTIRNDYPCPVTGQWSLLLRTAVPGFTIYDYGSFARVYQQVGSAWQEVISQDQYHVTIPAHQTLTVSLLLEGISATDADPSHCYSVTADFHVENIANQILQGGFREVIDSTGSLRLTIAAVDLAVGPAGHAMPETYEDTLPYVVPCNKDYDDGYVDGNQNPVPDNTDPLPSGATPPPACSGEDDLVSAMLTFPLPFHGTWTLTIPAELRVWQQGESGWEQVESGTAYAFASTLWDISVALRVEGLSPTVSLIDSYLTISARYTDESDTAVGLPLTDDVLVEVVSVDLQVQGIGEFDETTKPALVIVNDDYDEGNTHPISHEPVTDNNRLHGQIVSVPPGIVANDDDLVHATLTVNGPSGQGGKFWIEVTGEPSTVNGDGTGPGEYPGYQQYIRIWLPDGTPVPRDRANALPLTIPLNAQAVDLLIEGLALPAQTSPIRLTAHFEPDGDYPFAGVSPDVVDSALADLFQLKVQRTVIGTQEPVEAGKTTTVMAGEHVVLTVVGTLQGGQSDNFRASNGPYLAEASTAAKKTRRSRTTGRAL